MTRDNESLSGAHSLHALNDAEAAEFETTLAESESLRTEVTGLRDTAVELALAVPPVEPSAGAKAALMALIADVPQLPAEDDASPAPEPAPGEGATAPDTAKGSSTVVRGPSHWFARPIALVAGVAAAAALIVGGIAVGVNLSADDAVPPHEQLQAAEDSRSTSTAVAGGGLAVVEWSPSLGLASVQLDEEGELPAASVYQLWYIDDDGPRSAGTFTGSGRVLSGTMHEGDTIAMTIEPRGGSEAPTTNPVLLVATA
jgi:anti-sigma-K factor RskA